MKHQCLDLLRKITLISVICLLIFPTTSCANNQTTSAEVETTQTPAPEVETTETPSTPTNSNVNQLPAAVKSAVLSDATKRIAKSVATLRITQVQQQNWPNSCLGLAEAGTLCAQVIVPGWKVVVSDGKNELVYRTDDKGKQVKLENSQK